VIPRLGGNITTYVITTAHHKIAQTVKRVEFVSDRVSYLVPRGHWFNIIVLNVHALSEEKSDDSKYSFYDEIEQAFYHFPNFHMTPKVGRENIFKLTTGNEGLHQETNDKIVNFATTKKSSC